VRTAFVVQCSVLPGGRPYGSEANWGNGRRRPAQRKPDRRPAVRSGIAPVGGPGGSRALPGGCGETTDNLIFERHEANGRLFDATSEKPAFRKTPMQYRARLLRRDPRRGRVLTVGDCCPVKRCPP
jgi:hypothetical protein